MYTAPASWPDDISGNSGDRSSFARRARNQERLENCLPALRFTAGCAPFSSSRNVPGVEMHPPNKAPCDG